MHTPNHGESVDTKAPKTVGAIPGLKNKIMTALAAIGLAVSAEKVEGATVIIQGLPNSSQSGPTKISGLATSTSLWSLTGLENSRLFGWAVTNDASTDRITFTLSPTDVYGAGGTLTITGTLIASTNTTSGALGSSITGWGATYQIGQEVRFGREGDTPTTLASLNSGLVTNNNSSALTVAESWSGTTTFTSSPINITQPGTYNLDSLFTRNNVSGYAKLESFSITYNSVVPEPSTTLMAGSLLATALLRRRRPSSSQE